MHPPHYAAKVILCINGIVKAMAETISEVDITITAWNEL
jgi:hypothetical protein